MMSHGSACKELKLLAGKGLVSSVASTFTRKTRCLVLKGSLLSHSY